MKYIEGCSITELELVREKWIVPWYHAGTEGLGAGTNGFVATLFGLFFSAFRDAYFDLRPAFFELSRFFNMRTICLSVSTRSEFTRMLLSGIRRYRTPLVFGTFLVSISLRPLLMADKLLPCPSVFACFPLEELLHSDCIVSSLVSSYFPCVRFFAIISFVSFECRARE